MKGRLLLVNVLLLALTAFAAWMLQRRMAEAQLHEAAILGLKPPPPLVPPFVPVPAPAPAAAGSYLAVADRMLFVRDRNPTVVLEPPAPPPPKVMPPLPFVSGVIDFGAGPTVIMSEQAGGPGKGYRPGQSVGEFKLLAANNREVLLEWDGKRILKKVEELKDKSAPAQEQANAAAAPAAAPAPPPAKPGPGAADMGNDTKSCQPGDTSPAGTVLDGYRKVVAKTPFGDSCRWERVK